MTRLEELKAILKKAQQSKALINSLHDENINNRRNISEKSLKCAEEALLMMKKIINNKRVN